MIREATQALLTTLQDPAADEGRVRSAAQALMNAVRRASREEVAAAMRELSAAFALPDLQRAGFAAMLCGALVEGGFDPSPVAGPLMEWVDAMVRRSAALAEASEPAMAPSAGENDDPRERFEQARLQLAPRMPAEAAGWEGLPQFWPPAIAALSAS